MFLIIGNIIDNYKLTGFDYYEGLWLLEMFLVIKSTLDYESGADDWELSGN